MTLVDKNGRPLEHVKLQGQSRYCAECGGTDFMEQTTFGGGSFTLCSKCGSEIKEEGSNGEV